MKKLEENLAKHEKQMSLSLPIMPRNPIITAQGNHVSSSKSCCFEKNEIEDVFIYDKMPAAISKYLEKREDELQRI